MLVTLKCNTRNIVGSGSSTSRSKHLNSKKYCTNFRKQPGLPSLLLFPLGIVRLEVTLRRQFISTLLIHTSAGYQGVAAQAAYRNPIITAIEFGRLREE